MASEDERAKEKISDAAQKGKGPRRIPSFLIYPLEYLLIIKRNPSYRLYLFSHLCQHFGDWFIRIASLLSIERLAPGSATALSGLILAKMIPQVLLSHVGGSMADTFDRRKLLIVLDTLGSIVTLGLIVAVSSRSLSLFYTFTSLRATVYALYEPATKSIVSMLVDDPEDLKRANTMNGMVWSLMLVVGGAVAGAFSAALGVEACYVIDSATYLLSAVVIAFLRGDFRVASLPRETKEEPEHRTLLYRAYRLFVTPLVSFTKMLCDVLQYLWRSGFGLLVFMKATGSIVWGFGDTLNVAYSFVPDDEAATSRRLGYVYSCMGIGCFLGPIIANFFTDPERPKTLQFVCIVAIAFMTIGWLGVANAPSFGVICVFTAVKTVGSSTIWINSSLTLQRLAQPQRMGRVMAFEFACAMLFDAMSATVAGRLIDGGYAPAQIATGASTLAATLLLLWSTYHLFGRGAARNEFNQPKKVTSETAQVVFA